MNYNIKLETRYTSLIKVRKFFQNNYLLIKNLNNIINNNINIQSKICQIIKTLLIQFKSNKETINIKFFILCLRYINTKYNLNIYININADLIFIDFPYSLINSIWYDKNNIDNLKIYYKRLTLNINAIQKYQLSFIIKNINLVSINDMINYVNNIITFFIIDYINEHLMLESSNFINIFKKIFESNLYNLKILDIKIINDNILFIITNDKVKYLNYLEWYDEIKRKQNYIKHNLNGMYSELSFRDVIIGKINYYYLRNLFNNNIKEIKHIRILLEPYHII